MSEDTREAIIQRFEAALVQMRECSRYTPEDADELESAAWDAISLLKAQEPRVFDADEIVLSAEPSGWLWLEMENGHCGEAYKSGRTISGFINFGHGFDSSFTSLSPKDYGKTWRCWTSRPTYEQREAVKWE